MGMENGIRFDLNKDHWTDLQDRYICSFDVIISMDVIEHIIHYENYMKTIHALLKKGGLFICTTPNIQKQWLHNVPFYDDPTHVKPYTKRGLCRLFSMFDFEVIELKSFGTFPPLSMLGLYRLHPSLMFTGQSIICIGRKK